MVWIGWGGKGNGDGIRGDGMGRKGRGWNGSGVKGRGRGEEELLNFHLFFKKPGRSRVIQPSVEYKVWAFRLSLY